MAVITMRTGFVSYLRLPDWSPPFVSWIFPRWLPQTRCSEVPLLVSCRGLSYRIERGWTRNACVRLYAKQLTAKRRTSARSAAGAITDFGYTARGSVSRTSGNGTHRHKSW
jgi:hypothetical protein